MLTTDQISQYEQEASAAVDLAKATIIIGANKNNIFFRAILMMTKVTPNWSISTAATDGSRMLYNPAYLASLTKENKHIVAVFIHELLHILFKHPIIAASGLYDIDVINVAFDLAINCLIKDSGYELPEFALQPGEGVFEKTKPFLAWPEYYDWLLNNKDGKKAMKKVIGSRPTTVIIIGKDGSEECGEDYGGMGGILKIDKMSVLSKIDQQIDRIIQSAVEQSRGCGCLSAHLSRNLNHTIKASSDWKHAVLEFASESAKHTINWCKPNRRYLPHGMFIPTRQGLSLGTIGIAIDLSGSITDKVGSVFWQVAKEMSLMPQIQKISWCCHDSDITTSGVWEAGDGDIAIDFKGGGGTSHIPVFKHFGTPEDDEEIVGLVCLTDCQTQYPREVPPYPVLWCCYAPGCRDFPPPPPFGTLINIE